MKKLLLLMGIVLSTLIALADDVDKEATAIESTKDNPKWTTTLKEKYSLTDEQMKSLSDSGISYPQMAMAAELAKQSNKSIDEVLKMRSEQKMGWGAISKELGIKPGSLGRSVSEMRHAMHDKKHQDHHQERHREHRENREKGSSNSGRKK